MGKSLEDKIVVIGHLICFERKIVSKNNEGTKEEIIFPKSSEELKNFIKILYITENSVPYGTEFS